MKQEETYRKIMRIENKIDELRAKQFEIVLVAIRDAERETGESAGEFEIELGHCPCGGTSARVKDAGGMDAELAGKIQETLDDCGFVFAGYSGSAEIGPDTTAIKFTT